MPEQYIITGTVTSPQDFNNSGVTVQAFDRDLPSLERRKGLAPQELGTATTDAEGRFQIAFTLEQFSDGEGISVFRRVREQNADLSFRVFQRTGQELRVRSIEALDREFGPNQIIFNVPTPLEVTIFIEAPVEANPSEYEQLLAQIAPVVEDLPLAELTDEDFDFLGNELGLEQQREVRQRLEWLRRSALLAQESGLPAEAFYGWGRQDLPAGLAELAEVPLKDLAAVLNKLVDLPDDNLRQALEAAVAENIIPTGFRSRLADIVKQLKQRNQLLQTVVAQLQNDRTKAALVNYTVTTFDQDAANANLGLDITDDEGKFSFSFYRPPELAPAAPPRNFSFQVITPAGETVPENARAVIEPDRRNGEVVPIRVKLSTPEPAPFEEQLNSAQLQASPELIEWLRTNEINTFADIRRKGGLRQLEGLPQVEPALIHQIEALADLDRVSSTIQVNKGLLDKGYDSVLAIAGAPYSEFIGLVADENSTLTPLQAARVHVIATVQTNLLHTILAGLAADSANGFNLPEPTE